MKAKESILSVITLATFVSMQYGGLYARGYTARNLMDITGYSKSSVYRALSVLTRTGMLECFKMQGRNVYVISNVGFNRVTNDIMASGNQGLVMLAAPSLRGFYEDLVNDYNDWLSRGST